MGSDDSREALIGVPFLQRRTIFQLNAKARDIRARETPTFHAHPSQRFTIET